MDKKIAIVIRDATPEDAGVLMGMLRDKAEVEGLAHVFDVCEEQLTAMIARRNSRIVMAYQGQEPVGFANYHFEDSTFTGKSQINIKDLYAVPSKRGQGIGKALLEHIAQYALTHDFVLLIAPLISNQRPLQWYMKLGAKHSYDASVLRIDDVSGFIENLRCT
jgi:GNAT superfamily N-acetyltransferase